MSNELHPGLKVCLRDLELHNAEICLKQPYPERYVFEARRDITAIVIKELLRGEQVTAQAALTAAVATLLLAVNSPPTTAITIARDSLELYQALIRDIKRHVEEGQQSANQA